MEPTIVEKGQIRLVGFTFFGDPFAESGGWTEENEIGRLWARFVAYLINRGDQIRHVVNTEVAYEVHVENEETAAKGYREVFVGVEVEKLEGVPADVVVKILPPGQYAVFTLRGEQITSDWPKVIHEWMLGSGHKRVHGYSFQLYDQRFKGLDNIAESEIDVYVPVK